jgi:cytochrome c5
MKISLKWFSLGTTRTLKALIVFALLTVTPLFGESKIKPLVFNAEFPFSAEGKTFPIGQYKIMHEENSPWVEITAKSGAVTKLKITTVLARDNESTPSRIVFDKAGTDRVLSEVWFRDQDGLLLAGSTSKGHAHETVIVTVSGEAIKLPGNEIYAQTCQKCHGPKGEGNPAADKFYQTDIPKLDSAVVQAKSDQELKDIIMHGKRNMPPVRIGQPTVQHLLPPESVDAVISFIRTFK